METEEEVAAADDVFFAAEMRKARDGKTPEQSRAEAEDCLRQWRAAPKTMPLPWWVVQ
jgi:hypothetical protein